MIMQDYYLIAFDSTHAAMSAEAFFNNNDANIKLIPLPSIISAGCGFGIKIMPTEVNAVGALLERPEINWSKLYKIVKAGSSSKVEPWIL